MEFKAFSQPRPKLLVASHERSGTHFLINALGAGFGYDATNWIDFELNLGRLSHSALINPYDPLTIRAFLRRLDGVSITNPIKTHHPVDFFVGPIADAMAEWQILYIVRNPLDVLASFRVYLRSVGFPVLPPTDDNAVFLAAPPRGHLLRYQMDQKPSMLARWCDHARGWTEAAARAPRILVLRYEDLDQDYTATLARIGRAIGVAPTAAAKRPGKLDNVIGLPREHYGDTAFAYPPAAVETVWSVAGGLLTGLGYRRDGDQILPRTGVPAPAAAAPPTRARPASPTDRARDLRDRGRDAAARGAYQEARRLLDQSLQLDRRPAGVHVDLARVLEAIGETAAAVSRCRAALARQPDHDGALDALAACLDGWRSARATDAWRDAADELARLAVRRADRRLDAGRPADAAADYRRVVALRPGDAVAAYNFGYALLRADRAGEAAAPLRRAAVLAPQLAEAWISLAEVAVRADPPLPAVDAAARAVHLAPTNPHARLALGAALKSGGHDAAAVAAWRASLVLAPAGAQGWYNLGVTLADLARPRDAVAAYERALDLAPDNPDTRLNLGYELLRLGDYRRGWALHEARLGDELAQVHPELPLWSGAPGPGTLLLYGEQGHGDVLQFARYAPLAAARGWRVVVECPEALVRLLETGAAGVAAAYPFGRLGEPADCWRPMMSLPHLFETTLDDIPGTAPYLRAPATAVSGGFRVGLVWAGEPRPELRAHHAVDQRRSVPLAAFAPLIEVPGVSWVSLQYGPASAQLRQVPFGARIVDPMGDVRDFADTAALVAGLDLVITVDTAVAHLAGGLGTPVWVLSRWNGCWRWLGDRDDTPWYPKMRLFHQPRPGAWADVIEAVRAALRPLSGTPPPTPPQGGHPP